MVKNQTLNCQLWKTILNHKASMGRTYCHHPENVGGEWEDPVPGSVQGERGIIIQELSSLRSYSSIFKRPNPVRRPKKKCGVVIRRLEAKDNGIWHIDILLNNGQTRTQTVDLSPK